MDFQRSWFGNYEYRRPSKPVKKYAVQKKDIALICRYAAKLGLRLENFRSNDHLELYYDLLQNEKSLCYLFKGWADPGFRLGEYIEMNRALHDFKNDFYEIFKICSSNYISIRLDEKDRSLKGIDFGVGIYQDGFNQKVFSEILRDFTCALNKIREIL